MNCKMFFSLKKNKKKEFIVKYLRHFFFVNESMFKVLS
jgi:hypothetical protein